MPRIAPSTRYLVAFTTISRAGRIPPLEIARWFATALPDMIPIVIYRHVRTHLTDQDVAVTTDLDALSGALDLGRLGAFTITDLDAPEDKP